MNDEHDNAKEELHIKNHLEKERQRNDSAYAIKLVEKIVFGMVTLILVAVLTALVALVIIK